MYKGAVDVPGELLALRWDDVDLEAASLQVNRALSDGEFTLPKRASGHVGGRAGHRFDPRTLLSLGHLRKLAFLLCSGGCSDTSINMGAERGR